MNALSTDDVPHNQFKPHGRAKVSVEEGYLVVFRAEGPFNSEFLEALQEIEPVALNDFKSANQKWIELVVFEKDCTATFDFFLEYEAYLTEMKNTEMAPVASAFVISPDLEGALLIIKKVELCFKNAGIPLKVFESEPEARLWLDQIAL